MDPVAAVLDDIGREHEVGGDEGRKDERIPPGYERKRGRDDKGRPECGPAHLPEMDPVILHPPPGQKCEGVRYCGRLDEARVVDEDG